MANVKIIMTEKQAIALRDFIVNDLENDDPEWNLFVDIAETISVALKGNRL